MDAEEELSEGFVGFSDEGGLRKSRGSKRKLSGSSGHALSENNVVLYIPGIRPWRGDTPLGVLRREGLFHRPSCSQRRGILPS